MLESNPYEPPIARMLSRSQESVASVVRAQAIKGAWFGAKFIGLLVTVGSVIQWVMIAGALAWVESQNLWQDSTISSGATKYFTFDQCVAIVGWQIAFGLPLSLVGALTGGIYMGFAAVPRIVPKSKEDSLVGEPADDVKSLVD